MIDEQDNMRINVKIPINLHKAIQYAKIETRKTSEEMVNIAIREYLLKLGFLKDDGNIKMPEVVSIEEVIPEELYSKIEEVPGKPEIVLAAERRAAEELISETKPEEKPEEKVFEV